MDGEHGLGQHLLGGELGLGGVPQAPTHFPPAALGEGGHRFVADESAGWRGGTRRSPDSPWRRSGQGRRRDQTPEHFASRRSVPPHTEIRQRVYEHTTLRALIFAL